MPYNINFFGLENKIKSLNAELSGLTAKKVKYLAINKVVLFVNPILQSSDFQKLGVYSKSNVCSQICKVVSQNLDYETDNTIKYLKENTLLEFLEAKKKRQKETEQVKETETARKIENIEAYLKTAIMLINSDNYIEQGLGFCALTGRRTIEIFKTARFSLTDDYKAKSNQEKLILRQKNCILFSGQAKKKDEFEAYPILILGNLTPKKFLQLFLRFREKCNEKRTYRGKIILPISEIDNTKTQLRVGKKLEISAKKYFSTFWTDEKTTAKDTRQAYSYIAVYEVFTKDRIFIGAENRKRVYLQNTTSERIKTASYLLGHESIAPQEKYFLKLEK